MKELKKQNREDRLAEMESLKQPYSQYVKMMLAKKAFWRKKGFNKMTPQEKMQYIGQRWQELKRFRDNLEHDQAVRREDAAEQAAKPRLSKIPKKNTEP
eukprot:SAG31_NODE_9752_length_1233_cov_1.587302_1_plen_99_part_00